MRCAVSVTVGEGACGNDAICLRHCQRAAPTITGAFLRRVKWSMCHSTIARPTPDLHPRTRPRARRRARARASARREHDQAKRLLARHPPYIRRRSPACMRRAPGGRDRSRENETPRTGSNLYVREARERRATTTAPYRRPGHTTAPRMFLCYS